MDLAFLAGRILLGGMFFLFGMNHVLQFGGMSTYAMSKRVPMARLAVFVTALMLLGGGASLVLGVYPTYGIWVLVIFLIPTTFYMHNFWAIQDFASQSLETINFFKNIGLLGALLMMQLLPKPWPYSLHFG